MADTGTKSRLIPRLTTRMATRYLRFVAKTSSITYAPKDSGATIRDNQPIILGFWHGQFLLLPAVTPSDVPAGVMIARHEDADVLSSVMAEFGFELIRGAGAGLRKRDRGGAAALRASLTALKNGVTVGLTADVPPGPARRVGDGIITLARMSGRPIIPYAVASSRFRTMNSWSRLTINLPFSKLGVTAGEPIHVPKSASAEELEALRQDLETQLNALTLQAYEIAGVGDHPKAPITGRPIPPGFGAQAYRTITRALEPIGPGLLNRRARRGKEDVTRQNERLGKPVEPRPNGRLAWFHAASVGELNAIRPLLREVNTRHPELNLLITTGTVTSAQIAQDELADLAIHQFVPIDGPRMVKRFLDHWRPDAAFFVESEIWPNLIYETSAQKIPLVLLNARMSDKSLKAWRNIALKRTAASLFTRFDLILAQTPVDMLRFTRLCAANVEYAGNLKIDAPMPVIDPQELAKLRHILSYRPIFTAASTHKGEEEILADAHRILRKSHPDVLTVIVPRHPERGATIEDDLAARDLAVVRRLSQHPVTPETDIYVADTLGELPLFYEMSDVAFIGGSLVRHGGQNPIEAIRHDVPVLSGPHVHNFEEIYATLRQQNGVMGVSGASDIAASVRALLDSADDATEMQKNADAALSVLGGALERTLDRIAPYLTGDTTDAA